MHQIKFSKCPIGKHKGEYWEKLDGIPNGEQVVLTNVTVSKYLPRINEIQMDTFQDWTEDDFAELMRRFYGFDECVLLKLTFTYDTGRFVDDVGNTETKTFTTFRAYEWKKHKYYLDNVGKEFEVVMT